MLKNHIKFKLIKYNLIKLKKKKDISKNCRTLLNKMKINILTIKIKR